jgi:DNA-binding Lrp family transcriptional regulator
VVNAGFLRHHSVMTTNLDERDQQILALLRGDAWLSYAALSIKVNLSASAVQRRVERLMAAGVILGARAQVAVPASDRPLTLFVLAELTDEAGDALKRFTRKIGGHPAVVEAHYVAGESDVVLKLSLPDMAAYDRFVETCINASGLVRKFKTLTALRSLTPSQGQGR